MLQKKQDWSESVDKSSQLYVPLKQLNVDAKIRLFAANVTITQVFRNDENVPIEAVYCFPIEEQAAVYGFVARIDDREIVAELREKKKAQEEYNNALQEHYGAYMFEQDEDSQDNFLINVGALPPNKECYITISYVSELDLIQNGNTIRFVIPTAIAPRYNPNQGGIASPANTTTEYVQTAPYTIKFHCCVEKYGISSVSSVSHPIKINFNQEDVYLIEFAQNNIHLDRDIIMDFELAENRSNTIVAVESKAIMVSFTLTEQDCRRLMNDAGIIDNEFIFIVDCSGSMNSDNKIGLALQAMLVFLKSLPIDCYFNIIFFGSEYMSLFNDITVIYNEENVRRATRLLDHMTADLGGTELLRPLKWLKTNPPIQGRSRQIFLLTDGEISNVDEVLQLCRSMANSTRIFSFGLGHAPSHSLIKGLARTTNGRFTFIPPHTNVDVYVAEQLLKALQPCITNVQIRFNVDPILIRIIPSRLPPVFFNDRVIVYAIINDNKLITFDHDIIVQLYKEQYLLCEAKVNCIPSVSNDGTIARLAAKAHILQLQRTKRSKKKIRMKMQKIKEKIINISLKRNILSPYTAFIGIEKRVDASNADMVLREVPIQITTDDSYLKYLETNFNQICYSEACQAAVFRSGKYVERAFDALSHILCLIDRDQRDYQHFIVTCNEYNKSLRRMNDTLDRYVQQVQKYFDLNNKKKNTIKMHIDKILKDCHEAQQYLKGISMQYKTERKGFNSGVIEYETAKHKLNSIFNAHYNHEALHNFIKVISRYDDHVQNYCYFVNFYEKARQHFDNVLESIDKNHELQKTSSAEERQQLSQSYRRQIFSGQKTWRYANMHMQPYKDESEQVGHQLKPTCDSLRLCMDKIYARAMRSKHYLNKRTSEMLPGQAHKKTSSKKSCKTVHKYDQKDLDMVRDIITKQKFDGLWNCDTKFIKQLTGKFLSKFEQSTKTDMFVSAIIVVVLETRFSSLLPMWYGVAQKTRKRLLDMLDKDNDKFTALLENIQKQL